MADIFKKDRKSWTHVEEEQVQYFFRCNEFFSKIFERQYFQDLVQLAYYSKVSANQPLYLTDNKRPVAIILLKGNISVHKRQNLSPSKRQKHILHQQGGSINQFSKIAECLRYNQTVIQSSQCKVASLHGEQAQIIFVPSFLYNKFILKTKEQKDKVIFTMLNKMFKTAENRYIMDLARSDCKVKELKINSNIYEQGQKPESVFLIIEGSAKIQRPGFSQKSMQMVVVSTNSLLGEKDLCYSQRQTSAVCCSSSIRLLEIPKEAFLKFAKLCLPQLKLEHKQISLSPSRSRSGSLKKEQNLKLPIIMRFRSARRSEQESQREYNLIKNSHVLLDASRPSKNKIRSKSSYSQYPKDMMQQKIKLFKKLRPIETKLDLSHRIL